MVAESRGQDIQERKRIYNLQKEECISFKFLVMLSRLFLLDLQISKQLLWQSTVNIIDYNVYFYVDNQIFKLYTSMYQ